MDQELSPACPPSAGCAPGAGRKAVSSDMGSADAAPGPGMGCLVGFLMFFMSLHLVHSCCYVWVSSVV